MKILTREHSLNMARLIAAHEGKTIDANELTIENPIVRHNGVVEITVYNIDSFETYDFLLYNTDEIELVRVGENNGTS